MNHASHHHHHHAAPDYNRAFAVGVALNVIFVVIEVFYGVIANSLALITDAGHNLSDVMGLLLAWGASYLAGKQPSTRRTYGYSRATPACNPGTVRNKACKHHRRREVLYPIKS
jgi:cobalt-zinc-cadmium efflux system protein